MPPTALLETKRIETRNYTNRTLYTKTKVKHEFTRNESNALLETRNYTKREKHLKHDSTRHDLHNSKHDSTRNASNCKLRNTIYTTRLRNIPALGDRWFRDDFNSITPLPTLSPGLRSGPSGSLAGVHHFLHTLHNAEREPRKVRCQLSHPVLPLRF